MYVTTGWFYFIKLLKKNFVLGIFLYLRCTNNHFYDFYNDKIIVILKILRFTNFIKFKIYVYKKNIVTIQFMNINNLSLKIKW